VNQYIRLRATSGPTRGQAWESSTQLHIGRDETQEVFLDDASVSRKHAEIRATERGWKVRDLRSTNGTFVNGHCLRAAEAPLRPRDIIRCGDITLVVEEMRGERPSPRPESDPRAVQGLGSTARPTTTSRPAPPESDQLVVQATAKASFEEALSALASWPGTVRGPGAPRPGDPMLVLLRAGYHLGHHASEDELLHCILNDAVKALDAQRGAIVLADGPNGELRLRALATGNSGTSGRLLQLRGEAPARPGYSQNVAQRSFQTGESVLCRSVDDDPELALAQSIAEGTMASVVCALLRTPRNRLGVLHLDRSPWQPPFTTDDLHLADALAANVSAGIEAAQLLRKQRELFFNTITVLGQVVELRDEYTGEHTRRVTEYSLMLARQLQLPEDEVELIHVGAPLHDIGKIGIHDDILNKKGPLDSAEFEEMKTHTVKGAAILATIPDLAGVIPIVRWHHERWDGRGYPDRLAGENIPRIARIVAVADAFDAMTSKRPYRDGMPPEVAFREVEKNSGKQFDPEVAAAMLALRERIQQEFFPGSVPPLAASDATTMLSL
jgi:putative nucleotidyltransferase with HDIG domain